MVMERYLQWRYPLGSNMDDNRPQRDGSIVVALPGGQAQIVPPQFSNSINDANRNWGNRQPSASGV